VSISAVNAGKIDSFPYSAGEKVRLISGVASRGSVSDVHEASPFSNERELSPRHDHI